MKGSGKTTGEVSAYWNWNPNFCCCSARTWTLLSINLKLACTVFVLIAVVILSSLLSSTRESSYAKEIGSRNDNGIDSGRRSSRVSAPLFELKDTPNSPLACNSTYVNKFPSFQFSSHFKCSSGFQFVRVFKILEPLVFWSTLPLLALYCAVLVGVVKEKTSLITFFLLWLCLENVGGLLFLVLVLQNFRTLFSVALAFVVVFVFGLLALNFCTISCAAVFRKQVYRRKSRPLEF